MTLAAVRLNAVIVVVNSFCSIATLECGFFAFGICFVLRFLVSFQFKQSSG